MGSAAGALERRVAPRPLGPRLEGTAAEVTAPRRDTGPRWARHAYGQGPGRERFAGPLAAAVTAESRWEAASRRAFGRATDGGIL